MQAFNPSLSPPIELNRRMHAALRGLRKHATAASRQAQTELSMALAEGADPNAADDQGLTPLMFLATDPRASDPNGNRVAFDVASIDLCHYGADPTLSGCTFLRSCRLQQASMCLREIFKRELAVGDYLHDQQSPLHALVLQQGGYLAGLAESHPALLERWNNRARASDGKTALHVLWSQEETIKRSWSSDFDRWQASHLLVAHGARLDVEDAQGIRPAELMTAAANAATRRIHYPELVALARALAEQRQMEAHTATGDLGMKRRSGLRL